MAHPDKTVLTKYELYSGNSEPAYVQLPEDNDLVNTDGTTAYEKPITDCWIHSEINLSQGEAMQNSKVIGRATDQDDNLIGTYYGNPYSNTMVYDVEFPDGEIKNYTANAIAEKHVCPGRCRGISPFISVFHI